MRHLKVNWILSELTLGQVWDVNLLKNEPVVKDIILVAQGEMALEEFLKQVRESWQHYQLDLVRDFYFLPPCYSEPILNHLIFFFSR